MDYEDDNDIKNSYLQDWNENIVSRIDNDDSIERINEYVLHIARIIDYPDLKVSDYLAKIDEMGKEISGKIKSPKTMRPTLIIEKLNEFFFDQQEFKPNVNDYYNPVNNCLNIVLEKRTGIPITLSLVYIHLASYLDFK